MSEADQQLPAEVAQVGRQPILDKNLDIYGYELLYRANSGNPSHFDGDAATAQTVLAGFLEFGLHRLVGKHRVFINMTQRFFTDLISLPFDNQRVVIEVLEDFELTEDVVSGVRELHQAGYTIALDDYRFESRWEPLIDHCSVIKVDILDLDLQSYQRQVDHLISLGKTLLAEKVETREQFELAKRMGFSLFQGYFFAKPQTLSTSKNRVNKGVLLGTIAKLNDPNTDLDEVASLVELDPSLSFKLLRIVNSAAQGLPRKVASIKEAVVYIGLSRIKSWSSLILMAGFSDNSPELITTSLVRAELCKSLAEKIDTGQPESGYTIGLLSILDALLNQPMHVLLKEIPLPEDMIQALGARSGPLGSGLQCAIDLERCQWMSDAAKILPVEQLTGMYVQALQRAEAIRGEFSDTHGEKE
ncbi:MAG: HDOD domain-containing protein [Candidatus Thiodiazotropha sp.]